MNHPTYDDFWKLRNPDFSKIQCPVFTVGALHKVGLHLRGVVRGYEEMQTPKKMMLIHGVMDGDEMAIYNSPEMQSAHAALVRPLAQGQRHRLHGRAAGDDLRARRGRVPQRDRVAAARGPSTASCTSTRSEQRSRGVHERRQAPLGAAGRGGELVQLRLSGSGLDPLLRRRHRRRSRMASSTGSGASPRSPALRWKKTLKCRATSSSSSTRPPTRATPTSSAASSTRRRTTSRCRGLPPKGLRPHTGLAQGVARSDEGRRLSAALPPLLPARQAAAHRARNKIYKFEIEIWPTCNLFKKGHRIRIDVACGDSPALDFGGHYYGMKVGTDTYYHEAGHPSHVILPVIPAG